MYTSTQQNYEASIPKNLNCPRGVLIQYSGGGYDGCIWEWNLGLFDHLGRWHTIYSSGYAGISSTDEALKRFDLSGQVFQDTRAPLPVDEIEGNGKAHDTAYIVRYFDRESMKKFYAEMNPGLSLSLARWLENAQAQYQNIDDYDSAPSGIHTDLVCGRCQEEWPVQDMDVDPENYKGDGGIGIVWTGLICNDCHYEIFIHEEDKDGQPVGCE